MINRMSSYFPKGGHSATETELKIISATHKVKRHRNSDTKTGQQRTQQNYRLDMVDNELRGGGGLKLVSRAQPNLQFLKWYIRFSWLFGSHDNPLTF